MHADLLIIFLMTKLVCIKQKKKTKKRKNWGQRGREVQRMRKISYLSHDIFILSRISRMTFMKTELLKEKLIIPLPEEGSRSLEIKVEIKSCVHASRFTNRGNPFFYASRGGFFRRLTISSTTLYCNFISWFWRTRDIQTA